MINSKVIEDAIFKLCTIANTTLENDVFKKLLSAYADETNSDSKHALKLIIENAKLAALEKKPLCQDTGQVIVFVKLGEDTKTKDLNKSINKGVERAYKENFFRKSVVNNALLRKNTGTNTPCIIYTEIISGDSIELEVFIKGGGAENMSAVKMLKPTANEQNIIDFITSTVKDAGTNACPPLFIGVGIGGTLEYSGLLSKKALLTTENRNSQENEFAKKILDAINDLKIGTTGSGGKYTALDVKIMTDFTHIASLPVSLTINCHSSRHARCKIEKDEIKMLSNHNLISEFVVEKHESDALEEIQTFEVEKLKSLKKGQNILLSGDIYTARDMAHKKIIDLIKENKPLPFEIKNKIIFYAGPCPCSENEVIGPVGPTTSSRMDEFAPILYDMGLLATIGKGNRSENVKAKIKQNKAIYFSTIGGIACYLKDRVISRELIAFEELGTEAIYRLHVHRFPVRVDII